VQKEIKKTQLNLWHANHGANMADFGGYEMPLWYSSAKTEHLTVLTHAGVFDTSHMAVITVEGADAFTLLQLCFSRDLTRCTGPIPRGPIVPERCVYGVFLDEKGGVVDDAIVYKIKDERYMCVVNAGMGEILVQQLLKYSSRMDVRLINLTDKVGKMDIQGPLSAKILRKILKNPEEVYENFPYFSFKGGFHASSIPKDTVILKNGANILLSRTGYTGELGFEIFSSPSQLIEIWEMVLKAGEEFGILPCGLAARDSLRVGAMLPLSHQDMGNWPFIRNPWVFALPYNSDYTGFTKEFIGSRAIQENRECDYTYAFVGNDLRKVRVSEKTEVLDTDNRVVGTVLTCVSDMGIGRLDGRIYSITSLDKPEGFNPKGLSCGFIKVSNKLEMGHVAELRDTRRSIKVRVVDSIRPNLTARKQIVTVQGSTFKAQG